MFKSAMYITCFTKDNFIETVDDAIKAYKNLKEYDSTKEYTVTFDNENGTFDIWLLM